MSRVRDSSKHLRDVAAVFDERAATYDSAMHRWLASEVAAFAVISPDMTVLDVAGGTGLAAAAAGCNRAIVLDASTQMLRGAQARGLKIVKGDALRLPFADRTFDAVLCVAALFYMSDARRAVEECVRVTTRGGSIAVTAWAEDSTSHPHLLRVAAAEYGVCLMDPNTALGTESKLTSLLEAAGLSHVRVAQCHWTPSLAGDPQVTFRPALDTGQASSLAAAPADVREAVRRRFIELTQRSPDSFTALLATGLVPRPQAQGDPSSAH